MPGLQRMTSGKKNLSRADSVFVSWLRCGRHPARLSTLPTPATKSRRTRHKHTGVPLNAPCCITLSSAWCTSYLEALVMNHSNDSRSWEYIFSYTYLYLSEHCAPRRNYTNVYYIFFTEGVVNNFVAIVLTWSTCPEEEIKFENTWKDNI